MPRAKISEFSTTPGDNTDIDGINIAEGCAPSGINDAIRELMAQLKDFQSGAAGDNITVVGTLAAKGTSSSGADLKLYEDTDNGTNYVGFIAPASIASNVQWTLPSADGSSGQALQTNGSGTLSFATLGISAGGTGQTTANAAFNALAPSQTSNAGRYLKTDGTNTSWDLLDISTADITGTLPVANGGTGITSFGTGVATALGINVGSSGAFVTNGGALGTPSSGTVTNLTGTASININGTVGATTPNTGSFTTLTTSSTVTINGGTANGVAYLNGSKVLTTGSALTFDGTNLGIGGAASMYWSGSNKGLAIAGTTNGAEIDLKISGGTSTSYLLQDVASALRLGNQGNFPIIFLISDTEQMRLTSTGLGIGTSSPAFKLQVAGAGSQFALVSTTDTTSTTGILFGDSASNTVGRIEYVHSDNGMRFFTNGSTQATLDSSGNLGLGVTPSAWNSVYKVIDLNNRGLALAGGDQSYAIALNAYYDSGNQWRYKGTSVYGVTRYETFDGAHQWYTAPSGTAGNAITFTQALTLNANGALVLQGGNTSASGVGVAFPATQSASSDANTLDDYEEGTFTPTITLGGGSVTYTTQTGSYTKVGRLVTVQIRIVVNVATTPSGTVEIKSLPFTIAATAKGAISIGVSSATASATTTWIGEPTASDTAIRLFTYAAGTVTNPGAYIQNGTLINVTSSFEV